MEKSVWAGSAVGVGAMLMPGYGCGVVLGQFALMKVLSVTLVRHALLMSKRRLMGPQHDMSTGAIAVLFGLETP